MTRYPDVELVKALFESPLELLKELAAFLEILHVHKHAHVFVTIDLALIFPLSANDLRLCGNRAKSVPKLKQRLGDQRIRHRRAVIEPKRDQDFVPSLQSAHRWPSL